MTNDKYYLWSGSGKGDPLPVVETDGLIFAPAAIQTATIEDARLCGTLTPLVVMTPELAEGLVLLIKAAWAGYGGDVYDEPGVRVAIGQWEAILGVPTEGES